MSEYSIDSFDRRNILYHMKKALHLMEMGITPVDGEGLSTNPADSIPEPTKSDLPQFGGSAAGGGGADGALSSQDESLRGLTYSQLMHLVKSIRRERDAARKGMADRDAHIAELEEEQTARAEKAEAAIRFRKTDLHIHDGVDGVYYTVRVPAEHSTATFREIFCGVIHKMIVDFAAKNASYETSHGNIVDNFGTMGQFMKLYDKVAKLRKPLFEDKGEGAELPFESVLEVLGDTFGHVMLAARAYQRAQKEKAKNEEVL